MKEEQDQVQFGAAASTNEVVWGRLSFEEKMELGRLCYERLKEMSDGRAWLRLTFDL